MSDGIRWGAGLTPDELAARLKAHPFADVREPLMQKIVFVALRHAQQGTPVKTGTLRRSETTRVEPGGLKGFIGTNIKYAPFVHDGTRFMTGRPFFTDALTASRAEIQKLLQAAGDQYFKDLL